MLNSILLTRVQVIEFLLLHWVLYLFPPTKQNVDLLGKHLQN